VEGKPASNIPSSLANQMDHEDMDLQPFLQTRYQLFKNHGEYQYRILLVPA